MAHALDKAALSALPGKLAAGPTPTLGLPAQRTVPRRPAARKTGSVRCTLSDVQPKESVSGSSRSGQNGTTLQQPRAAEEWAKAEEWTDDGGAPLSLQAKILVSKKRRPDADEQMMNRMDALGDTLGQNITLQLVSVDVDPASQEGKRSEVVAIADWAAKMSVVADKVLYTAEFVVDRSFGTPGAIILVNNHQNEFFLMSVSLMGHPAGPMHFPAYSWVHSQWKNPAPRVFFSNQVYLPEATPKGLRDVREQDLKTFRGNGAGVRREWENVYDYDVYNDLGDVDKDEALARPILGGSTEFPYPRRMRTGRPPAKADAKVESRLPGQTNPYVPRDEAFEEIKQDSYASSVIKGLVQKSVPDLRDHFDKTPGEFDGFEDIDRLYDDGVKLSAQRGSPEDFVQNLAASVKSLPNLPDVLRMLADAASDESANIFRFPQPQILSLDRYAWLRDQEFARQALAGVNPCTIERLKVFPPVSALDDPELYGPTESSIRPEHIVDELDGLSIDEALSNGKLFILDYHDLFMPFIGRINALGDRKGYATRTLFFLTEESILRPLAIELSLPAPEPVRQVIVPSDDSTGHWLWMLAKAHVSCNDAGIHQLASHWLRTHASTEPYVIATNRRLSPMHPVFKLLHPHFRYTLEINASARQSLICADGVIEHNFLPGKYAMEISSAYYNSKWRFDREALPEDLIARGVAVEDEGGPSGVKVVIDDYPFADDGLLIWGAIEAWVKEYVGAYYGEGEASVQRDEELQAWWEEIRTRGHADKKDEAWWPRLRSPEALVRVLTTIVWANSGLHAAINFGQFAYVGYMPNKPTLMRRLVPRPGTPELGELVADPEAFFLASLPSQVQTTTLMAVVESLSTHSPDEEYLGSESHPNWFDSAAVDAFRRFKGRLVAIEAEIARRNGDPGRKNRNGAGILPYELLMPTSKPGVTGRGIPNSISI